MEIIMTKNVSCPGARALRITAAALTLPAAVAYIAVCISAVRLMCSQITVVENRAYVLRIDPYLLSAVLPLLAAILWCVATAVLEWVGVFRPQIYPLALTLLALCHVVMIILRQSTMLPEFMFLRGIFTVDTFGYVKYAMFVPAIVTAAIAAAVTARQQKI